MYILIDASYFIFYRYFALKTWWNFAKQEGESDIPTENERFNEKFRSTFNLREIKKRFGDGKVVIGKDCPKNEIWRNEYISNYKAGRPKNDDIKDIFKMVFDENLFDCHVVLSAPHLEADDCIAIATRHIRNTLPDEDIVIVTSDMDYLQLADEKTTIVNLKFQKLTESKQSFNDPQKDLFCKIVAGDKSDNIPSVFPRCGLKTAAKYYDNQEAFQKKLVGESKTLFERNKRIIDFNEIPLELSNQLALKIDSLLM